MDIEFIGGKKVSLTKPHCINKVLEDLGKTLKENVVNLATSQLFTITNEAKELDEENKERYPSITTRILWIMKKSRPDLETAVYLL